MESGRWDIRVLQRSRCDANAWEQNSHALQCKLPIQHMDRVMQDFLCVTPGTSGGAYRKGGRVGL